MSSTSFDATDSAATSIDDEDLAQLEAARRLVIQYLNEALATERALVTTLRAHIGMTPVSEYRTVLERHLGETQEQSNAIERRLGELGAGGSLLATGTGFAQTLVGQGLALSKGPVDLLRGKSGEEKLLKNAKDECATEALEIATYEAIEALARAVGDSKTEALARRHREEEERMLGDLRRLIPILTRDAVRALAAGHSTYDAGSTGAAEVLRRARAIATDVTRR
ncbi:MAG: ferritin-like domain-containing protein [Actinomycetota bacterium]|nr:ferritin-like domain-containing protein [Actinomycetota bacterium]